MKELGELWGKESRNPISANTGKGTPLSVVVSLIDSHTGSFWVLFQAGISLARCFWKKLGEEQGPDEALQPITKPTEGDVGSNCTPKGPTTPHTGSKHPKKPREAGKHFQGCRTRYGEQTGTDVRLLILGLHSSLVC